MNNIEKLDRCYSQLQIDNLVEELRCFACNDYLRFGLLLETPDGNVMCNRCSSPTSDARRAFFLERLIKTVSFPCRNRKLGCSKSVTFDTAEDHKRICRYKCIPCPYYKTQNCVWKSAFDKMSDHIIEDHKTLIKTDLCFSIDVNCDKNEEFVAFYEEDLYLVQYRSTSSLLAYTISQFNETIEEQHSKIQISDSVSKDCIIKNGKLCKYYRINLKSDNSCNLDIKPFIGSLLNSEILYCNVIVEWPEMKCKWDGCEMITSGKTRKNHEECCDWRLYKCFLSHCDDSFRESSGKEHFRKHSLLYVDSCLLLINSENVLYKFCTFVCHEFVGVYYVKESSGLYILLKSSTDQKPKLRCMFKYQVRNKRLEKTVHTTWNEVITISNDDPALQYNCLLLEIERI